MIPQKFDSPWSYCWRSKNQQRSEVQEVLLLAADRFEANGKAEKAEQIRSSAQAIQL